MKRVWKISFSTQNPSNCSTKKPARDAEHHVSGSFGSQQTMASRINLLNVPITETSNELTKDIDIVDSLGIARLLRQSDAQLFSGFANLPCVFDSEIHKKIIQIIEIVKNVLHQTSSRKLIFLIPILL